ncbi:acetate--CoA ligase family protein [Sphingomonas sp. 67-41]|uniref:acetate--CoA ligase family protein n=1 Tax=Sphingomonas TaxID=13687 RepID=UPI00257E3236|nr:acetate--CoA ligase family protein [Sphingomonas sp. 67-41]
MATVFQDPQTDTASDNLTALFAPRSVAVIGASSDQRRFGGRPIQYLLEAGFDGPIYPVNPGREEIQGLKAYPSIKDVPGAVDCAILAISADVTQQTVEDCIASGVKSAILYGAGFSETGAEGQAKQDQIVATARAAGLRLLGPNCMGLMNPHAGFYGTFASALEEGVPAPGKIAVASQSGGYGGYLMKHLFRRGLGISQWVTTGNEADVDIGDALWWMAGQPESEILLAYIEGLRDSQKLIAALDRARRANKPVVMMKVGRTAEGSAAAASHTASLTGEDSIYDAVFDHYGVHRARTTDELLDIAYALSKGVLPKGPRVGVISISGGVGVQCADFVSDAGLAMGSVPAETQVALKALVPHCSPANPIDMTGLVTTNHDIMEKTLDAVFASNAFDATLIFLGIAGAAPSMARPLQQAIANAHSRAPDQLVFVSVTADPEMVREYDAKGLLAFEDPSRAIAALSALAKFRETFAQPAPKPVAVPAAVPLRIDGKLNEAQAKALLAAAGVPSPKEALAKSPEEAAKLASEIGFPVVVKVASADILHKTEYGGVALGLTSADAVRDAVETMAATIPAKLPDAKIDGYLISEMVKGGVETIVGIHHDEAFGPVVTFGLGGTLVELLKDTVCALAPVSEAQVLGMIGKLKTAPLLTGWRGSPRHDIEALAKAVSGLSVLAVQHADQISTIEVNPLVVRTQGVVALDAVIEIKAK